MSITVRNVSKNFGSFEALRDVSVEIPTGTLTALLGPSGGGKSTLLRIIAGLEAPDSGTVEISGTDSTELPPQRRNVGFVFQHYAPFKHMTVAKNVAFGLDIRKRPRAETRKRVQELLELVHIEQLANRYPNELSGGQRQRMALARALAIEPEVLLLDEPFGALDAQVRKELRAWLRRLHDEVHVTTVFVTHDQEEALEVSDRVVVMNEGRIEQIGAPEEVYERPASPFVYSFLGDVNLFHGRIEGGRVKIGENVLDAPEWAEAEDQAAVAYVRTFEVEVAPSSNGGSSIQAMVRHIRAFGPVVRLELDRLNDGKTIEAHVSRTRFEQLGIRKGERVFVSPTNARVFIDNA